jgi:hypothetical protein
MFISNFFHKWICQIETLGEFGLCCNYLVMDVMTDSPDETRLNDDILAKNMSRDGLQEQMVLLNRLSEKLDEYFALRSMSDRRQE